MDIFDCWYKLEGMVYTGVFCIHASRHIMYVQMMNQRLTYVVHVVSSVTNGKSHVGGVYMSPLK